MESRLGSKAWEGLLALALPKSEGFAAGQSYSDSELSALLRAACEASGLSHEQLLQGFGEFLVPDLLTGYHAFLDSAWKTLDLLEHTEITMHAAARMRDPSASPPGLKCRRSAPDEVLIEYSSPRRLCPMAKGIILGIARFYGEQVSLSEPKCMHRGDPLCLLVVRLMA